MPLCQYHLSASFVPILNSQNHTQLLTTFPCLTARTRMAALCVMSSRTSGLKPDPVGLQPSGRTQNAFWVLLEQGAELGGVHCRLAAYKLVPASHIHSRKRAESCPGKEQEPPVVAEETKRNHQRQVVHHQHSNNGVLAHKEHNEPKRRTLQPLFVCRLNFGAHLTTAPGVRHVNFCPARSILSKVKGLAVKPATKPGPQIKDLS